MLRVDRKRMFLIPACILVIGIVSFLIYQLTMSGMKDLWDHKMTGIIFVTAVITDAVLFELALMSDRIRESAALLTLEIGALFFIMGSIFKFCPNDDSNLYLNMGLMMNCTASIWIIKRSKRKKRYEREE